MPFLLEHPRLQGAIKPILLFFIGFVTIYFFTTVFVLGDAFAGPPPIDDQPIGPAISIPAMLIAIVGGAVTPILTGLLTKLDASSPVKALVSCILVGILAICDQITSTTNGEFDWQMAIVYFFVAFASHGTTYSHL